MKILIISDDKEFVSKTNSYFKDNGFDTIVYKWLLKALDNIEEIQPDLILLNSSEYPRHWKTLVQFAKSGIGGENVDIFLYEPTKLSEDEEEKAKALGITGCFSELENIVFNDVFKDYINKTTGTDESNDNNYDDELPTVDSIVEEAETEKPGYILLTNPVHKNLICGKIINQNENRIEVMMDFPIKDVQNNDEIELATYFNEVDCYSFSAEIFILNDEQNNVILSIKEIYEEN